MEDFDVTGDTISIGDPVMGLVRVTIAGLQPGVYRLVRGAIASARGLKPDAKDAPRLSLDGPYLYVLDASKEAAFVSLFHEYGKKCCYNMMRMAAQHNELANALGAKVGFYWEEELSGEAREGEYIFDVTKIQPSH